MDKHDDRKICSLHKIAKVVCLLILTISLSVVPFAFATSELYVPSTPSSSDEPEVPPAENPEETDAEDTQDVVDETSENADGLPRDDNDGADKDADELSLGKDDESGSSDIQFDDKHHWIFFKCTDPTCTSAGMKIWRCIFCHDLFKQEEIPGKPALGHDFNCEFIWADDYSSATVKITCTRCQEINIEDTDANNVKISSTTTTDDESKTTTTTYTAEYIFKYDPDDDQAVKIFEDKKEITTPSGSEGEGGGQTGGDGGNDDKTDEGDQTGGNEGGNEGEGGGQTGSDDDKTGNEGDKTDEGSQSGNDGSSSNDYYAPPETPAVQPPFTGAVAIESPIEGFTAHIEGAPAGEIAMAVNQVTSGPAFEALMNTITARFSSVNGQTFDIAGVFDVNLSIENKNMTEEFGTLTLEFPINSKFNGRTAHIFHCHGAPGNITSFTPVTVSNGKVVVGGVTQLSTFAVAIADNPHEIPVGTIVQHPTSSVQTVAIPQEVEGSGIRHIEPVSNGGVVSGLSSYESTIAKESPIWRTYDSGMSVMIVRLILISIAAAAIITMVILVRREKRTDEI